ncbi:HTH-type transcriptional regulatory protein GabR [Methylobrevis pamukkalensis]|uniref:HTH-type transcriptional regulatory protein GabR n=2 Tax=Methylobrevis pamukkalensis TaxID=1439726 RepID=A0A1E3H1P2_9HYPH|nr:HTH-type transcriptional regulatory protein GabR [Methylobrevis pamukkalensis]
MSMRRRLALIDWARRHGAWIFEDDYDSEMRFAGPPLTAMQGIDDAGRVVYLGTFSKVLFPGLRVGYMVVPEALLDDVIALRRRMDRQPSTLGAGALADLLDGGHFAAHLRRIRRRAQAARDGLIEGLSGGGDKGFSVEVPEQGLHLVARLPTALAAITDGGEAADVALCARAVAAGVDARPLSSLYLSASPQAGLVLGFSGFEPDRLREAGRRLQDLLG